MINGQFMKSGKMYHRSVVSMVALLVSVASSGLVFGQAGGTGTFGFGVRQGVVGGISIDAAGELRCGFPSRSQQPVERLARFDCRSDG